MRHGSQKTTLAIASLPVTLVTLMALLAAPAVTHACGYHDKKILAQGMLNVTYPEALHVTGAIWSEQKAGTLAMPDTARIMARGETRKRLDEEAFHKASLALHAVGGSMEAASRPAETPHVAVALVSPMLWTRLVRADDGQRLGVAIDASGPSEGDLVIITDEPVLHSIHGGKLTVTEAHAKGLLRCYGTPEQESLFLEAYGSLGAQPLPEVPADAMRRRSELGNR